MSEPTQAASATAPGPHAPALLRLSSVTKVYPGTTALRNVDFALHAGAVNVLVGENGAGKSTMMKIIAGIERPTQGEILLDGRAVQLHSTDEARKLGIGIVHQELNLFPNLTITENLFLGRELTGTGPAIDMAEQRRQASALLHALEHALDPDTLVGDLRIGQQQIVEIARALAQDARILILDEPTSALSAPEVEILFRVIRDLRARGVGIVYISHRLEELVRIGDFITVLRDGSITGSAEMTQVDVAWIVRQMVGASTRDFARAADHQWGDTVLKAQGIRLGRPGAPGFLVDGVDLAVRRGEIVGIYGLMGAGRTELLECIFGCHPDRARGSLCLDGRELLGADVATCIAAGLAMIPEDRKADGLIPTLSIGANLTLSSLLRLCRGAFLSLVREREAIDRSVSALAIKARDPAHDIGSLSGGNQQKVVIGRALMTGPKVLLMDEPSRGIDISAKSDVFKVMRDLSATGIGIVFVTSDLDEVMALSDRIVVMSNGRITAEFGPGEATQDAIVAASAAGHNLLP
ncbi:MAG: sugar ABC transporter ATP-binding protein [Pseudomonadota bacterium]|nr:sugar ABC transporter ATP-binding protein [Pseudomonadota bacterium]